MAVDNTHIKYLKGRDKKIWGNYLSTLKAQSKLENFMDSLNLPKLAAGEEYDIPVRKNNKVNKNK